MTVLIRDGQIRPDKAIKYRGLLYGIELELEGHGLYEAYYPDPSDEDEDPELTEPVVPAGWSWHEEHSIHGCELVLSQPQPYEVAASLMADVFRDVARNGWTLVRSPRGSTHVHINVQDYTWEELGNAILACAWAEPFLIELAGKGRKHNLFALSYANAPLGWAHVIECYRNKNNSMNSDTHYMATNFETLFGMGTIEFRMGPTARNYDEAMWWFDKIRIVAEACRGERVDKQTIPSFVRSLAAGITNSWRRDACYAQAARNAREVGLQLAQPGLALSTKNATMAQLLAQAQAHAADQVYYSAAGEAWTINDVLHSLHTQTQPISEPGDLNQNQFYETWPNPTAEIPLPPHNPLPLMEDF